MRFTKMHGIGNDFVMVDTLANGYPDGDLAELSRQVNDRRFGIGGDGLILVEKGDSAPFRMRMFNPDGSESEMCGNGIRCFAKLLRDHGHTREARIPVDTGAGRLVVELLPDGRVRVDMGMARLHREDIPMLGEGKETFVEQRVDGYVGTAVSMGNPHLVIFLDDVSIVDLAEEGSRLEHCELFPNRTNVHFAQVLENGILLQRTWERGAGATLACGTGACSVAVAAHLTGRAPRKSEVRLPGGRLEIEYLEDGRVLMTGPAATVFDGEWPLA
ncbi:MAG TPA: diaminopimelate epimerase [Fimbriimonadaceae bacterium]|nr:diaminopimelate epimerase [Fimbriimonadaceae bacterium]